MRILLLDCETSPNVAYVWSLINNKYISPDMMAKPGRTISWAAKWYGEDEVMFNSVYHNRPDRMFKKIHGLLDKADAVVHYNGVRFDIPVLNKEFLLRGMTPPAPYKQIDLLKTARQRFRLPSYKLSYITKELGLGGKVDTKGFSLWEGCMRNDPASWELMREYNIGDVVLLEKVYDVLKPWIKGHANWSALTGEHVCPNCGSHNVKKRGTYLTGNRTYQRYACSDCGAWSRDILSDKNKKAVLTNAQ